MIRKKEVEGSLNELVNKVMAFKKTGKFLEAMHCIASFTKYSVYNGFLIFIQNPFASYVATERAWKKKFGRTVKDNARPILILNPRGPIGIVYDVSGTEGRGLPETVFDPIRVSGEIRAAMIKQLYINAAKEGIAIKGYRAAKAHGGLSGTLSVQDFDLGIVFLNQNHDLGAIFSLLIHELSHIYLGHTGKTAFSSEDRSQLPREQKEFEAELVSYFLLNRFGYSLNAEEGLAIITSGKESSPWLSVDVKAVSRVAGKIEKMTRPSS